MSDIYSYENNTDSEKKSVNKKKMSGGMKKFFGAVFLGITFGIVASVIFNLSNLVTKKIVNNNSNSSKEVIEENITVDEDKKESSNDSSEGKITIEQYKPEEDSFFENFPLASDNEDTLESSGNTSGDLTVEQVAKEVMPSVVAITNKSVQEIRSLYYGMGIQQYEAESAGSGIIIGQNDTELLIVTNNHVVEDADTLSVCFSDDEVLEAKIKGTDSENDLAVISVELSDISGETLGSIKIAAIGSSDELNIGQQVVAIGNALGYGQSVTTGIVSALDRSITGEQDDAKFIQTDAAINPGNSGGALLNMKGEVIGINSAKLANTKIEGMCYAIPIDTAKPIINDLMNMTTRSLVDENKAGYLGITGFSVTDEVSATYDIPKGIYISETESGRAAEKSGIKKGDVIVKFDGMSMDSINKLKERLCYYEAGETVDVVVARSDNGEYKEQTLRVTLDSREGTSLDPNNQQKSSDGSQENNENGAQDGNDSNSGNRSGEFNIGGSKFQYSVPNNIFEIFGH